MGTFSDEDWSIIQSQCHLNSPVQLHCMKADNFTMGSVLNDLTCSSER